MNKAKWVQWVIRKDRQREDGFGLKDIILII